MTTTKISPTDSKENPRKSDLTSKPIFIGLCCLLYAAVIVGIILLILFGTGKSKQKNELVYIDALFSIL